jgi:hypothetical protein
LSPAHGNQIPHSHQNIETIGRHCPAIEPPESKAGPGNQALMVRAAPHRFFVPPYVGPSGWVGVWLDGAVDWDELADLLGDSFDLVAPKRLRLK